jgi:hypothetical protein
MTDRLERNLDFLKILAKATRRKRTKIISQCNADLICCLSECCLNVIKGNVPLKPDDKKRLNRHRKLVRLLAKKKPSLTRKRTLLLQKGGALPALLIPVLTVVGSLLLEKLTK